MHTLTLENCVTFNRKPVDCQVSCLPAAKTLKCVRVCGRPHIRACVFAYFQAKFCYIKTEIPWISLTGPKSCHYDCYRHYPWFPHSIYKITENEFKVEKAKAICSSGLDQLAFGIRSKGKGSGVHILSSLETQTLSLFQERHWGKDLGTPLLLPVQLRTASQRFPRPPGDQRQPRGKPMHMFHKYEHQFKVYD